ncbi:MAG: tetratricopeptide repeat protein [Gammaproteobacteria bacterium]|nr:tetratricopeptide repeat protein [Gammaproteobacteria bacterium]
MPEDEDRCGTPMERPREEAASRSKTSFLEELKRRHVYRVAAAYAVTAWLLLQVANVILPTFGVPGWLLKVLIAVFVSLFPVALLLAWAFEATSAGVRRTEPAQSSRARPAAQGRRVGLCINLAISVVLAAAVGVLAWQITARPAQPKASVGRSVPPAATVIPAKSIAVLPFENLSADKKNAYFAAGIQDLILTKLADIGGLKVIARTSTMKYKSHPSDLAAIGKELGVATLLEGSVQRVGNQVLINVQLIDAKSSAHLWAQAYTRQLNDIFGVEGEVAGKIAAALKATLNPAESARLESIPTTNPNATNLFLRAQYQFNQSSVQNDAHGMRAALPLYREAVAVDPDFALAWAKLSYAESMTAWFRGGGASVPKLQAAARKDAARAQQLAPDATATQLALGYVAYYGEADYAAALSAFRAALAGRPNSADAMFAIGNILRRQHRWNAAIAHFRRALALDPRNALFTFVLARTYIITRRYTEALAPLRRALALDPANASYRYEYVWAIVAGSGDLERAWAAAQGDALWLKSTRMQILVWQRKYAAAIALVEAIPDTPANFGITSQWGVPKALQLADLYRLAGDIAHAKPLYARARAQLQPQIKVQAGNAQNLAYVWSNLADAEFGLGQRKAAFAATAQSLKLAVRLKAFNLRLILRSLAAMTYAQAGRADLAVPLLAKLLAAPDGGDIFAPILLRLNPSFDRIRHDPRFQALLKKYPAPTPVTTAH